MQSRTSSRFAIGACAWLLASGLAGCRSSSPTPSQSPMAETPPSAEPVATAPPPPAAEATPLTPEQAPRASAPPDGAQCQTDADCVPASCCHPDQCVPKDEAPDCSDTFCTRDCRGGTLDCGGRCLCRQGVCGAQLNDLPGP